MMKTSTQLILALVVGALLLQGSAEAGGAPWQAAQVSAPVQVATPTPAPASPAVAIPEKAGEPVVKADTKENFEAVATAIQQQMQPGGRWQYVSATGRRTIDEKFADMRALFDRFSSVNKMDQPSLSRLLDDQNAINAILAKDDGNRLVCEHLAPTGSHITKTVCRSYSQIRAEESNSQFNMRIQERQGMTQKVGGH